MSFGAYEFKVNTWTYIVCMHAHVHACTYAKDIVRYYYTVLEYGLL